MVRDCSEANTISVHPDDQRNPLKLQDFSVAYISDDDLSEPRLPGAQLLIVTLRIHKFVVMFLQSFTYPQL